MYKTRIILLPTNSAWESNRQLKRTGEGACQEKECALSLPSTYRLAGGRPLLILLLLMTLLIIGIEANLLFFSGINDRTLWTSCWGI